MKKLIKFIGVAALLATTTIQAQVITNGTEIVPAPVSQALNFLTTPSTNWMLATYGIFTKNDGNGAGIGALYKVSENFGAVLRLDCIGTDTYMPSGNFQLQVPVTIMGKFTATPFLFSGVATPLNENKNHSSVIGVFGIGAAIRLPESVTSKSRMIPADIVYDYEKWTSYDGGQHRIGMLWRF